MFVDAIGQLEKLEESKMKLEKSETFGVFFDNTNTVRGLWLRDQSSTTNSMRLQMILADVAVTKGRTVDASDLVAIKAGACPVEQGPPDIGGYVMMFPSARL